MNKKDFVLITPAHNEANYIRFTLDAVISQTIRPKKWIIVCNGSDDSTRDIVSDYIHKHRFIQLIKRENKSERNFASKVYAFNYGLNHVKNLDFQFIGNLDADVSFSPKYYERILHCFEKNSQLGIAGGQVYDKYQGTFKKLVSSTYSVNGMIQLFRFDCFKEIGGYLPLKWGGIDMMAEVAARMYGWQTQTFHNIKVYHHRRSGTAKGNIYSARYRQGKTEFVNGYHFLFELTRCFIRIREMPYIVGSAARLAGYISCYLTKEKIAVPQYIVNYLRKEQLSRLLDQIKKLQFKNYETKSYYSG